MMSSRLLLQSCIIVVILEKIECIIMEQFILTAIYCYDLNLIDNFPINILCIQ